MLSTPAWLNAYSLPNTTIPAYQIPLTLFSVCWLISGLRITERNKSNTILVKSNVFYSWSNGNIKQKLSFTFIIVKSFRDSVLFQCTNVDSVFEIINMEVNRTFSIIVQFISIISIHGFFNILVQGSIHYIQVQLHLRLIFYLQ